MSNLFVCAMGIGTVFFGLICLILLTSVMGYVCKNIEKNKPAQATAPANAPAAATADANKQEIIAASCAVIAEELGTDASNIKVTSFKKL